MSGHSKWSKVKHQKQVTDQAKGKIFTKMTMAIIVAVKEGGGVTDPNSNFRLRLAIEKARSVNMPKENIERAIEKGKGTSSGQNLQQVVYEAFGPDGVGIIIEAATDNKQRTVANIKNVLERGGGVLATSGAVSHQFQLVGLINIKKNGKSFDDILTIALEVGAIDIEDSQDSVEVFTKPVDLHKIKEQLEKKGFTITSFELYYKPKTVVPIKDAQTSAQLLKLLSNLEEIDDVLKVSANFDIPDEYL